MPGPVGARAHKTTEYENSAHISPRGLLIKKLRTGSTGEVVSVRPHSSAFYPDPPTETLSRFSSWQGPLDEVSWREHPCPPFHSRTFVEVHADSTECGKQPLSEWGQSRS